MNQDVRSFIDELLETEYLTHDDSDLDHSVSTTDLWRLAQARTGLGRNTFYAQLASHYTVSHRKLLGFSTSGSRIDGDFKSKHRQSRVSTSRTLESRAWCLDCEYSVSWASAGAKHAKKLGHRVTLLTTLATMHGTNDPAVLTDDLTRRGFIK